MHASRWNIRSNKHIPNDLEFLLVLLNFQGHFALSNLNQFLFSVPILEGKWGLWMSSELGWTQVGPIASSPGRIFWGCWILVLICSISGPLILQWNKSGDLVNKSHYFLIPLMQFEFSKYLVTFVSGINCMRPIIVYKLVKIINRQ